MFHLSHKLCALKCTNCGCFWNLQISNPKKYIIPPTVAPNVHPPHLDLLLGRIGQGVLRQQLINGAMKTFGTGTIITQDVDHQGVVEQTWRGPVKGWEGGGYSLVTRNGRQRQQPGNPTMTYEVFCHFKSTADFMEGSGILKIHFGVIIYVIRLPATGFSSPKPGSTGPLFQLQSWRIRKFLLSKKEFHLENNSLDHTWPSNCFNINNPLGTKSCWTSSKWGYMRV